MIIGGPVKSLDGALPFHRCVPGLIPGVCRQDGSDCQIGQGGVLRVWYACGFFHQYRIHILPKEGAYRQCTSARCVLCESLYPIHVWYVCKYSWILSGKQKKKCDDCFHYLCMLSLKNKKLCRNPWHYLLVWFITAPITYTEWIPQWNICT